MRALLGVLGLLAACTDDTSQKLQLLLADDPIALEAPTEILVQIVVVGADGEAVTIASPNLPSFATLTGATMRLAPDYRDAGDYAVDLSATTATSVASGTMRLAITRKNTGPMWLPVPFFTGGSSSQAPYARMDAPVCDKEGDNFTFEIDIEPVNTPVNGVADYTVPVDFAVTPPLPYEMDMSCVELRVEMPGLAAGDYYGKVHAFDVLGAEDPYGWVELGGTFHVSQ